MYFVKKKNYMMQFKNIADNFQAVSLLFID